ncbi:hypothetical protein GP486_007982 [Trichoglossum hirsutum]|uniref:Uncharacterized protein n=1 Tax=Trichoglossum hirsutum TaxID=265104 RepID=A0A9P8IHL2_9PEZI|nr:hypothetical protein GP486_007982 [Trichoglossum hirsutum]
MEFITRLSTLSSGPRHDTAIMGLLLAFYSVPIKVLCIGLFPYKSWPRWGTMGETKFYDWDHLAIPLVSSARPWATRPCGSLPSPLPAALWMSWRGPTITMIKGLFAMMDAAGPVPQPGHDQGAGADEPKDGRGGGVTTTSAPAAGSGGQTTGWWGQPRVGAPGQIIVIRKSLIGQMLDPVNKIKSQQVLVIENMAKQAAGILEAFRTRKLRINALFEEMRRPRGAGSGLNRRRRPRPGYEHLQDHVRGHDDKPDERSERGCRRHGGHAGGDRRRSDDQAKEQRLKAIFCSLTAEIRDKVKVAELETAQRRTTEQSTRKCKRREAPLEEEEETSSESDSKLSDCCIVVERHEDGCAAKSVSFGPSRTLEDFDAVFVISKPTTPISMVRCRLGGRPGHLRVLGKETGIPEPEDAQADGDFVNMV